MAHAVVVADIDPSQGQLVLSACLGQGAPALAGEHGIPLRGLVGSERVAQGIARRGEISVR